MQLGQEEHRRFHLDQPHKTVNWE